MNAIPVNTVLRGTTVTLRPLEAVHFERLSKLAMDETIWEFIPINMHDKAAHITVFETALKERERGTQFTFVIVSNADDAIIGSTRLMDIQREHNKLEIGWTWLHPDHWASKVNTECKLLLLTFCFEVLAVYRVQLKTDERNIRSRKAIEKIGGRFEGIFRNDMVRANGTKRNSAYFSITDEEWPEIKERLMNVLGKDG